MKKFFQMQETFDKTGVNVYDIGRTPSVCE